MLTESHNTNSFENGLKDPIDINVSVTAKKGVEQATGKLTYF